MNTPYILTAILLLQGTAVAATINIPDDQATIQAGIDSATNGDVVLISPGTYFENLFLTGKTITLASLFFTTGNGQLVEQTVIDGSGETVLEIRSIPGEASVIGLTFQNGPDGIEVRSDVQITNNRFFRNTDGIDYESGGGGLCANNHFENNKDDGIDLDGASDPTIRDNTIINNGDDGIEIRLHAYTGEVLNITITNNFISGNDEDGIQVIDHPGVSNRVFWIERNIIADSAQAGIGCMTNGNTTEDFSGAPIPNRIFLTNNTFFGNDHTITGGANLISLNNLFVNSASKGVKNVTGESIISHCLFWNNGIDSEESVIDNPNTLFTDPLLDSEFNLLPGSPAIDAGAITFDWMGETVLDLPPSAYEGTAPDIGAKESPDPKPSSMRLY